jgi:hypothetical protein
MHEEHGSDAEPEALTPTAAPNAPHVPLPPPTDVFVPLPALEDDEFDEQAARTERARRRNAGERMR